MSTRLLLAGEFRCDPQGALDLAASTLEGRCARLTVAVVASPPRLLWLAMPFCGVACLEQVQDDVEREALQRACRMATMAPCGVPAEHLVTATWRDLLRHAEDNDYDEVLLADSPTRLRDRLLVRRAGWVPGRSIPSALADVPATPAAPAEPSPSAGRRRIFAGRPRAG